MSTVFRVVIRLVFLGAYTAFLWASLHHIAFFFKSFEPGNTDWTGPYALAGSIDITALTLTIGVMFFRRDMPTSAQVGVWFFIIGLTGFSWLVNWEYAVQFQNAELSRAVMFHDVNPILASAFAFLNLAYSLVAEFFSTKQKTAAELSQEADRLEALEAHQKRIADYYQRNPKQGVIQRAAGMAKEAISAVQDIRSSADISDIPSPGEDMSTPTEYPVSDYTPARQVTGRGTVPIEEAAQILEVTPKYARALLSKGVLKAAPRNREKVTIASLNKALLARQKEQITGKMPALQLVANK